MCNHCMSRGCSGCSGGMWIKCGTPCFSLGPFRASTSLCPPIIPGTGSIIPFSSGISGAAPATGPTGVAVTGVAVGFGSAIGVTPVGNTITLPVGITTEAFNVPRDGTITSISATFTEVTPVTIPVGGTATITAQVYRAPAGSDVFTATNAFVHLSPNLSGAIAPGAVFQGTSTVLQQPLRLQAQRLQALILLK